LKKCRADHPRCQMPGDLPMPTRVIDVGLEGVREPFLFETKGSACKNKPYIALSYCWGWWEQHPPMKTVKKDFPEFKLKANYQEHLEAIKFSHMPKTIQDAVTITRKLGIQYLWVDALCIIQHDAEEWIRESGKMCDVYSNALLTISATQAEGSSPLAARAWCMQESVLSNRILHYTSDEMMWECNEAGWCECEGYDMSFFWRNVWSNYVHVFTRRSITDKKDKLPALSGLARKFSDLLTRHLGRQPTYLAGLWGDELLVRSLCWYVTYTAASWRSDNGTITGVYDPRRAEPWRAPTWSFMSLDAPISPMDALRVESAVEVLEATAEPLDRAADPFGQVASAKLVLRGRL
ncbi:HET-domain-containing protein, partial [Cryphonectria parasitica EP155]